MQLKVLSKETLREYSIPYFQDKKYAKEGREISLLYHFITVELLPPPPLVSDLSVLTIFPIKP